MTLMTLTPCSPDRPSRSNTMLHDGLLRLTRGFGGLRLAIAEGFERLVALNRADLAPDLVNRIAFAVSSDPDPREVESRADALPTVSTPPKTRRPVPSCHRFSTRAWRTSPPSTSRCASSPRSSRAASCGSACSRWAPSDGDDAPTDLVALCDRCHLDLVHGGRLVVTGLAPRPLTWTARGFVAYST